GASRLGAPAARLEARGPSPEPERSDAEPPGGRRAGAQRPWRATTMGLFWRCFFDFFYPMNPAGARATDATGIEAGAAPDGPSTRAAGLKRTRRNGALEAARPRHRPDVGGSFTVALVCALQSGYFVSADLLREKIGLGQILAFAAVHPMAYVLGCCVALLAVLLAVGDV